MQQQARNLWLVALCVLLLLLAASLYADKVYVPPQPPPKMIYTIKGPVVLYDDAAPGDLITAPNLGTIYYLNQDGKRVVFPDEQTFLSWYGDFGAVKTITQERLESFPLSGRNATIRPGTWLIKIQTAPEVYLIGFQKTLYALSGEAQAIELFGADWSKRVSDVPEYFFSNYDEGLPLAGADVLPAGVVYRAQSNNQTYIITPEGQRAINADGLSANHFAERFIITLPEPLNRVFSGPTVTRFEPRLGSPDSLEQAADRGPADLQTNGRTTEAG